MKKNLIYIISLLALLLFGNIELKAQLLLYDGFNYTVGDNIGGTGAAVTTGTPPSNNNWTTHSGGSGTATGTINIVAGNLSYTGLHASTGNMILMPGSNSTTSRDVNKAFTTSATVLYYSALINVIDNTQLTSTTAYDYCMHFGATSGMTISVFAGRLGFKAVDANNFQIGILNTSSTSPAVAVFSDYTSTCAFGTTYLVVVKVDISTSPISATLWINPSSLGGAEPAGGVTNNSGNNPFTVFSSICLRNGAATPKANIDEIRVGNTFADVTPGGSTLCTSLTFDKTTLSLSAGGATGTITPTVLPANATNSTLLWASSNTAVATVSQSGVVTPVADGTANITATTTDGSNITATCALTVSLIYEGFNYTIGDNIGGTGAAVTTGTPPSNNNWTTHSGGSGTATGTINIVSGSLSYSGFAAPTGNMILMPGSNSTTSRDVNQAFTTSATALYYSALINVIDNTQLTSTTAYDYCMHFGATSGMTISVFAGRLGFKAVDANNFQIGILNTSSTSPAVAVFSDYTSTCAFGTTYLVVVKVDISTSPISATLWINPSSLGGAEPAGGVTNNSGNNPFTVFSSICLRNGAATPKANIDEIRVGTTFAEVTPQGASLNILCSKVTLLPTTLSLKIGGATGTITPTVTPSNAANPALLWASDNIAVATVNQSGVVTPVGKGTANITAKTTDGSNITATCAVTVTKPVTGVSVSPTTLVLVLGGTSPIITGALSATVSPADASNLAVTWASDNINVATVDVNGNVSAVAAGTANITAKTTDGNFTSACAVTVTQLAASVTIPQTLSLILNGTNTGTLTATVLPSNTSNVTVTWASDNINIATVDATGKVTALTAGSVNITAITNDGTNLPSNKCAVTITIAVTSVSILPTTLDLIAGGTTATLTATVAPANATNQNVTWNSSNQTIASVDVNGVVTPVASGTVNITATTADGNFVSNQCVVTVHASGYTAVSSVAIPQTLSIAVGGDNATLMATITPSWATDQLIIWSSDNTSVATVDANGVVTAVAVGTANITAVSDDNATISSTCAVTVTAHVNVSSVTVAPATLALKVGGTNGTLTATVAPTNASKQSVTWATSDITIATVNSTGVVSSVGAGTATITATSNDDNTKIGTCVVTVTVPPTSVSISPTTLNLKVGGATATITPTVLPANATNKNVTWASSNTAVATVSASGVVTGITAGTANINATTVDGGISTTVPCLVTVTMPVASITLAPTTLKLNAGGATSTVVATVSPANATNKVITWSSSNTAVATVNASGVVTPLTAGTTNITATSTDGSNVTSNACAVTVVVPVTGVTVAPTTLAMFVGAVSTSVTATVLPANATNAVVTWTSSNTAIATVNSTTGAITAVAAGTANITATSTDGTNLSSVCAVTVSNVAVTSITLAPTTMTLNVGGATGTIVPTIAPANATIKTVAWVSSATAVATVDASGNVTPVAVGTTTITATCGGKTATCVVTVTIPVTSVKLDRSALTLYLGNGTATLTATVLPSNATIKDIIWSSSNSAVATVTNAVITTLTAGTTTITATTLDGSLTANCVVTVTTFTGISMIGNVAFKVYPNPSNGNLNITMQNNVNKKVNVIVRNILGQEVYNSVLNDNNFNSLNLSHLNKGAYILEISIGNEKANTKLILQ